MHTASEWLVSSPLPHLSFTDYKRQPSLSVFHHTPAATSVPLISDLSEASFQFQRHQQTVVDQLVQCPNALSQLKQHLASLVLPLGDGKVDQHVYACICIVEHSGYTPPLTTLDAHHDNIYAHIYLHVFMHVPCLYDLA